MPKYALVGCLECDHLQIVGTRHTLDALRQLAAADERERVVEARSRRLKARAKGE